MIQRINHIGLCVNSIDDTLAVLAVFGAKEISRQAYPELGQTSCMVGLGPDLFELMEPIGEQGVVPKFLATHGQGLHHISLLSDDLDADYARLQQEGIRVLGDLEDPMRVVFTHPKTTAGVIYELTDIPFNPEGQAE